MDNKIKSNYAIALAIVIASILYAFATRFESINDNGQTIDRWTGKKYYNGNQIK